jgi:hypothetical protein
MANCLPVLFPTRLPAMLRLSMLTDTHTLTDTDRDKIQIHFKLHDLPKYECFTAIHMFFIYNSTFPHNSMHWQALKNNNFNFEFNYTLKFYVTSGNAVSFSSWQKKRRKEKWLDGKKDWWTNRVIQSDGKLYMSLIILVPCYARVLLTILFWKIFFFVTEVLDIVHIFELKKATKFRRLHLLPSAGRMGKGENLLCWNRWKNSVLMLGNETQYRLSFRRRTM